MVMVLMFSVDVSVLDEGNEKVFKRGALGDEALDDDAAVAELVKSAVHVGVAVVFKLVDAVAFTDNACTKHAGNLWHELRLNAYLVAVLGRGQHGDGTLGDELAVLHDGDAIRNAFNLGEKMRVEEDGLASVLELRKHIADFLASDGVNAVSGFVEDDEVWVVNERLCKPETLHHALGILAYLHGAPVGHANNLEGFVDAFIEVSSGDPGKLAEVIEHLFASKVKRVAMAFGQVTYELLCLDGAEILAEDGARPRRREDYPEQTLDEGRLTCTVRTEERIYLAAMHVNAHSLQGRDTVWSRSETFGDTICCNC